MDQNKHDPIALLARMSTGLQDLAACADHSMTLLRMVVPVMQAASNHMPEGDVLSEEELNYVAEFVNAVSQTGVLHSRARTGATEVEGAVLELAAMIRAIQQMERAGVYSGVGHA